MKYKLIGIFVAVAAAFGLYLGGHAFAATFNPNNIIGDGIFDNTQTMNPSQINNWLDSSFGSTSCISPDSDFTAPDPIGYSPPPGTGFEYGGNVTAGQVIYDAAQAYGLNPQVLLTTLQKEQSLVSGSAGCNTLAYADAAGYNCPDGGTTHNYTGVDLYTIGGVTATSISGSCVGSASDVGFSQQVIHAAWLLKFGQERSEGNISWAVISGNWDNSDDPQSCYGGPVTEGYRQVCPGGPTTYYDGYTTIDGTSVQMDDGATAALYWYTPHLSGNENFFNIFSNWFGSTVDKEPVSSLVVQSNQSGKIYFISLNSNTSYFVPTWSTMEAFGLNQYQVIPMDDSQIATYTNGGTLTTLIWNNDDQKIYLVDGGQKYWFQLYCTQWGLDCLNQTAGDVTFMTSSYFDDIIPTAGTGQPLQNVNGTYYLMQNGTKEPFVSTADMQALGYTTAESIPISQTDLNSSQSLGPLQIFYPRFIHFAPSTELMYFDGQNYYYVPDYNTYTEWGLPQIWNPPTSTYNTTLPTPSGGNLTVWAQDGNGHEYLIDNGKKIDISSDPSTWNSGTFQTFSQGILGSLPTVAQQTNINIGGNIYVVEGATKRPVPTYNDYLWLGINSSNTLTLAPDPPIPDGVDILGDGAPFSVQGNVGLYITNGSASYHVPSAALANDFGIDWSNIRTNLDPNVLSQGYPSASDLSNWVVPAGGSLSYVTNKTLVSINPSAAANWGINTATQPSSAVDLALLYNVNNTKQLGQFVRNETTGGVYYGSSGTYHYIASYSTIVAMGGLNSPMLNVSTDFFTNLTQGSTYN